MVIFATKLMKKYLTLLKLKNIIISYQKKGKQIQKTPSSSDIKSVAVKHSKTASNLLNYIEKSSIITQELEAIEKPNIFDIELPSKSHETKTKKISCLQMRVC